MKDKLWFVLFWLTAAAFAFHEYTDHFNAPTQAELQGEYDAYRLCMQSAGKTRCKMTTQDFIRYYELKYKLEAASLTSEP